MQKINAEFAAHNVAMAFVQQYSKQLNSNYDFDLDSPTFYQNTKTAAQIYANTYDSVYDYISQENEILNQQNHQ